MKEKDFIIIITILFKKNNPLFTIITKNYNKNYDKILENRKKSDKMSNKNVRKTRGYTL